MMDLMSNHGKVSETLTTGNNLLRAKIKKDENSESYLCSEEREEISKQLELLDKRWEDLRKSSMERQTE